LSTNWKFTDCKEKPLLLFSCLDWGLGHTTRSVPLIKEFLILGCDLIVACNSTQKAILQPEFPDISFVELQGYGIKYARNTWVTRFKIILQLTKILTRIKCENRWLNSFISENKIDGLISDNRYGLYHPKIPCVFITHQLHIRSGYGGLADKISQKILYRFINRFSVCWVPDYEKTHKLAGILSHPKTPPSIPVQYIGALSRLTPCNGFIEKKIDVLVIISGPEPQRTILESLIIRQADSLTARKIVLVRGLPGVATYKSPSAMTIFNHVDSGALNKLVCESEFIVCRSGYTTIMDMLKLKKKMIVIPTPGQPEQEYLARYLSENHFALAFAQKNFDLAFALQKATNFTFNQIDTNMDEYKVVLKDFTDKISSLSPSSPY
jgi:uncharacterized protein (TIGR00661 family)